MAYVKRCTKSGQLLAVWRNHDGKEVSVSTGEVVEERAWDRAAKLEAESQFWDDHGVGVWQRMADAAFSPRYVHRVFIGRAHVPYPRFKALLREAEVKFQAPSRWRDRTKPRGAPAGRKWQWRGAKRTLDELMEHATDGLSRAALRFRLDNKWEVTTALSTPPLSRSEAGMRGANVSNNRKR